MPRAFLPRKKRKTSSREFSSDPDDDTEEESFEHSRRSHTFKYVSKLENENVVEVKDEVKRQYAEAHAKNDKNITPRETAHNTTLKEPVPASENVKKATKKTGGRRKSKKHAAHSKLTAKTRYKAEVQRRKKKECGSITRTKSGPREDSMIVHEWITDGSGRKLHKYKCSICNKEFNAQYMLKRHLPVHTDERKFTCPECGKAFRQASTLCRHKAIHTGERPHQCEICNKAFNRASTLAAHMKIHSGIKHHICQICGKGFFQKGNLRNHVYTHTGERPYECNQCHKAFNQMSNLKFHIAHTHSDVFKHKCATCEECFSKKYQLRKHEQTSHGITYTRTGAMQLLSFSPKKKEEVRCNDSKPGPKVNEKNCKTITLPNGDKTLNFDHFKCGDKCQANKRCGQQNCTNLCGSEENKTDQENQTDAPTNSVKQLQNFPMFIATPNQIPGVATGKMIIITGHAAQLLTSKNLALGPGNKLIVKPLSSAISQSQDAKQLDHTYQQPTANAEVPLSTVSQQSKADIYRKEQGSSTTHEKEKPKEPVQKPESSCAQQNDKTQSETVSGPLQDTARKSKRKPLIIPKKEQIVNVTSEQPYKPAPPPVVIAPKTQPVNKAGQPAKSIKDVPFIIIRNGDERIHSMGRVGNPSGTPVIFVKKAPVSTKSSDQRVNKTGVEPTKHDSCTTKGAQQNGIPSKFGIGQRHQSNVIMQGTPCGQLNTTNVNKPVANTSKCMSQNVTGESGPGKMQLSSKHTFRNSPNILRKKAFLQAQKVPSASELHVQTSKVQESGVQQHKVPKHYDMRVPTANIQQASLQCPVSDTTSVPSSKAPMSVDFTSNKKQQASLDLTPNRAQFSAASTVQSASVYKLQQASAQLDAGLLKQTLPQISQSETTAVNLNGNTSVAGGYVGFKEQTPSITFNLANTNSDCQSSSRSESSVPAPSLSQKCDTDTIGPYNTPVVIHLGQLQVNLGINPAGDDTTPNVLNSDAATQTAISEALLNTQTLPAISAGVGISRLGIQPQISTKDTPQGTVFTSSSMIPCIRTAVTQSLTANTRQTLHNNSMAGDSSLVLSNIQPGVNASPSTTLVKSKHNNGTVGPPISLNSPVKLNGAGTPTASKTAVIQNLNIKSAGTSGIGPSPSVSHIVPAVPLSAKNSISAVANKKFAHKSTAAETSSPVNTRLPSGSTANPVSADSKQHAYLSNIHVPLSLLGMLSSADLNTRKQVVAPPVTTDPGMAGTWTTVPTQLPGGQQAYIIVPVGPNGPIADSSISNTLPETPAVNVCPEPSMITKSNLEETSTKETDLGITSEMTSNPQAYPCFDFTGVNSYSHLLAPAQGVQIYTDTQPHGIVPGVMIHNVQERQDRNNSQLLSPRDQMLPEDRDDARIAKVTAEPVVSSGILRQNTQTEDSSFAINLSQLAPNASPVPVMSKDLHEDSDGTMDTTAGSGHEGLLNQIDPVSHATNDSNSMSAFGIDFQALESPSPKPAEMFSSPSYSDSNICTVVDTSSPPLESVSPQVIMGGRTRCILGRESSPIGVNAPRILDTGSQSSLDSDAHDQGTSLTESLLSDNQPGSLLLNTAVTQSCESDSNDSHSQPPQSLLFPSGEAGSLNSIADVFSERSDSKQSAPKTQAQQECQVSSQKIPDVMPVQTNIDVLGKDFLLDSSQIQSIGCDHEGNTLALIKQANGGHLLVKMTMVGAIKHPVHNDTLGSKDTQTSNARESVSLLSPTILRKDHVSENGITGTNPSSFLNAVGNSFTNTNALSSSSISNETALLNTMSDQDSNVKNYNTSQFSARSADASTRVSFVQQVDTSSSDPETSRSSTEVSLDSTEDGDSCTANGSVSSSNSDNTDRDSDDTHADFSSVLEDIKALNEM